MLDCINRVCEATRDTGTSSLPTTSTDDGEVADQLSEQENKPPNCGSPEQCNESHEENKSELIDGIENCKLLKSPGR